MLITSLFKNHTDTTNRAYISAFIWVLLTLSLFASTLEADAAEERTSAFAIPATDEGLPGAGPIRRFDWFQNLWESRREDWASTVEQDQGAVVFLGDSITQGWGGGLGAAFPGMKVANRGISGDTTRGVLIRLDQDVFAVNPAGIVLLIGTNDLEEKAAPEVTASNLDLILQAIKNHNPNLPVILCDVFPSSSTMRRPSEQIQKINALYHDLLDQFPQVIRVDTFSLFDDGKGDAKAEEFPDLLHLNEQGYAKWAAALRPVLKNQGLLP